MQTYASPNSAHSEELVLQIIDYWGSATTVSPNKEQASKLITDINGKKFRATHTEHHVDGTQTDFFREFIKKESRFQRSRRATLFRKV